MHRRDDAAARDEGAEEREAEGESDQRQVPDLQHVLAFLDHHRMQVRGHHEPRHEGGVLDRVPRPVTAPAEHFVRPSRAEHVAEREKEPGKNRPAPRRANPAVVEFARDERGGAEGERHGRADVAGVERRRMNRHPVVLQERIQVGAFSGNRREQVEWTGHEIEHHQKKDRDAGQHRERVRRDLGIAAAILERGDRREDRQQPGPEHQRALLPAPQRGDFVDGRQRGAGI